MSSAIILFAHGARDPEWAEPFFSIRERVEKQFPDVPVHVAFLEIMQPSLKEAVVKLAATGTKQITLIPLFLARGGHLKQDMPRLLSDIYLLYPDIYFHTAPAIGEVDTILNSITQWVGEQHQQRH